MGRPVRTTTPVEGKTAQSNNTDTGAVTSAEPAQPTNPKHAPATDPKATGRTLRARLQKTAAPAPAAPAKPAGTKRTWGADKAEAAKADTRSHSKPRTKAAASKAPPTLLSLSSAIDLEEEDALIREHAYKRVRTSSPHPPSLPSPPPAVTSFPLTTGSSANASYDTTRTTPPPLIVLDECSPARPSPPKRSQQNRTGHLKIPPRRKTADPFGLKVDGWRKDLASEIREKMVVSYCSFCKPPPACLKLMKSSGMMKRTPTRRDSFTLACAPTGNPYGRRWTARSSLGRSLRSRRRWCKFFSLT